MPESRRRASSGEASTSPSRVADIGSITRQAQSTVSTTKTSRDQPPPTDGAPAAVVRPTTPPRQEGSGSRPPSPHQSTTPKIVRPNINFQLFDQLMAIYEYLAKYHFFKPKRSPPRPNKPRRVPGLRRVPNQRHVPGPRHVPGLRRARGSLLTNMALADVYAEPEDIEEGEVFDDFNDDPFRDPVSPNSWSQYAIYDAVPSGANGGPSYTRRRRSRTRPSRPSGSRPRQQQGPRLRLRGGGSEYSEDNHSTNSDAVTFRAPSPAPTAAWAPIISIRELEQESQEDSISDLDQSPVEHPEQEEQQDPIAAWNAFAQASEDQREAMSQQWTVMANRINTRAPVEPSGDQDHHDAVSAWVSFAQSSEGHREAMSEDWMAIFNNTNFW